MRVLYYNWVDYRDPERRGGGVSVYQRNLMAAFEARPDVHAGFFTAGLSHDLRGRPARWEPLRHGPNRGRPDHYDIVNARPLAPAHHSFGDGTQIHDPATEAAVCAMVAATGPWDVIHFNNLEGLPAGVLGALRARFPDMRIVLSLHNYYPFCPQVNLWHQERETCDDNRGGQACATCLPWQPDPRLVRIANAVAYRLKRAGFTPGTWAFDVGFRWMLVAGRRAARLVHGLRRVRLTRGGRRLGMLRRVPGLDALRGAQGFEVLREARKAPPPHGQTPPRQTAPSQTRPEQTSPGQAPAPEPAGFAAKQGLQRMAPPDGRPFAERRAAMVAAINASCDTVLCVSDAVRRLAIHHGVAPALARTDYIGTQQADLFATTAPRPVPRAPDGIITLAYLGYMRADKGFFFLLDALETLPPAIAGRFRLLVAAKRGDDATMGRLAALGGRLAEVVHADGYSHDDLDALLAEADIGLVPVLWHDNLPQVAVEMHARHIPLLCADRGGARELGACPDMVFEAGKAASLHDRLRALAAGEVDLDRYWRTARTPTTMPAHLAALMAVYRGETAEAAPPVLVQAAE